MSFFRKEAPTPVQAANAALLSAPKPKPEPVLLPIEKATRMFASAEMALMERQVYLEKEIARLSHELYETNVVLDSIGKAIVVIDASKPKAGVQTAHDEVDFTAETLAEAIAADITEARQASIIGDNDGPYERKPETGFDRFEARAKSLLQEATAAPSTDGPVIVGNNRPRGFA